MTGDIIGRVAVRTSHPSLAADPTAKARAAWRSVGRAGPAYVRCKGLQLRDHSVVTTDRGKISLFGTTGMDSGHSGSSSLRVRVAPGGGKQQTNRPNVLPLRRSRTTAMVHSL